MLKLLACVSAMALAYPAAAQLVDEGQADTTADVAAEGVTEPVDTTLDTAADAAVQTDDAAADAGMTAESDMAPSADAEVAAQVNAPPEGQKPVDASMEAASDDSIKTDATAETDGQPEPMAQAEADAGTPDNNPAQVAAFVEQEFGNHDGDADGELTAEEFAAWLVPLQAQQGNHTEAELDLWAQGAFAQADTDGSASVSVSEMTEFLNG